MISLTRGEQVISTEELSTEAKQQLIARVADSSVFRKSPRLREFLLYTAECTLGNRLADVREQVIAEKVFQRKSDSYDFQDSIVRADARNLRKRLEKYFETDGWEETVVVTMPRGGYSLAFEPRAHQARPQAPISPTLESVTNSSLTEPASSLRQLAQHQVPDGPAPSPRILKLALTCLVILASAMTVLAIRWYPGTLSGSNTVPTKTETLPFSALFDNKGRYAHRHERHGLPADLRTRGAPPYTGRVFGTCLSKYSGSFSSRPDSALESCRIYGRY